MVSKNMGLAKSESASQVSLSPFFFLVFSVSYKAVLKSLPCISKSLARSRRVNVRKVSNLPFHFLIDPNCSPRYVRRLLKIYIFIHYPPPPTPHPSSLIPHPSPLTPHPSPPTPYPSQPSDGLMPNVAYRGIIRLRVKQLTC